MKSQTPSILQPMQTQSLSGAMHPVFGGSIIAGPVSSLHVGPPPPLPALPPPVPLPPPLPPAEEEEAAMPVEAEVELGVELEVVGPTLAVGEPPLPAAAPPAPPSLVTSLLHAAQPKQTIAQRPTK